MKQKAFEVIENIVLKELTNQEFTDVRELEEDGNSVVAYVGTELAYSIKYDEAKKSFELRSTTLKDGEYGNWKVLSRWLFDLDEGTTQDAVSIGNDFLDIILGPKRVEVVKSIVNKKKKKNEDSNMDPHFLFNRLMNIFPDFKEVVKEEKIVYGQIRYAVITREFVAPACEKLALAKGSSLEKLGGIFSDIYSEGDLEARAIIIHGIFNAMSDEAMGNLKVYFSEELEKSYKCSRGLKNKNLKPEKPKKKKKTLATLMSEQQQHQDAQKKLNA